MSRLTRTPLAAGLGWSDVTSVGFVASLVAALVGGGPIAWRDSHHRSPRGAPGRFAA